MKSLRYSLALLACVAAPVCFAQWQWVDKDGRKVFSDQPPPSSVPEKSIVRRPGARSTADATQAAAESASANAEGGAAPAARSAASAPSAPKVSGRDKELEDKKKQAQAAEAEKKKAQDEEYAKLRAESCDRARRSKQLLDTGSRIATVNAKGEREVMDDAARTVEGKRLEGVIARDCKAA